MRKKPIAIVFMSVVLLTAMTAAIMNNYKSTSKKTACTGACSGCSGCFGQNGINKTYYLSKKDKLFKALEQKQKYFEKVLPEYYGKTEIEKITEETHKEFERLIPEIPYIGGDDNPMTEDVEGAAMALAFYNIQKAHGRTTDETGKMIIKATEIGFSRYPKWIMKLSGRKFFTEDYIEGLKLRAVESQARKYKGDWVSVFVEGDGVDFDYGYNFTECGVVKLLHSQGADELTPYLCKLDFIYSKYLGEGLKRTTTIAEGEAFCDFRYKRE